MSILTIRGCDEELKRTLQNASKERGLSINKLVLQTLEANFKAGEGTRRHNDLTHLAGTWTKEEGDEFEENLKSFEQVNAEDWQ